MSRTAGAWHDIARIPSGELRQDDIPGPDGDWGPFALTFDGYERWGSFDACATIANECAGRYGDDGLLPSDVDNPRTCLFFEQRRWRHFGEEPDAETLAYIEGLLGNMREIIGRRDAVEFERVRPEESKGEIQ